MRNTNNKANVHSLTITLSSPHCRQIRRTSPFTTKFATLRLFDNELLLEREFEGLEGLLD